MDYKLVLLLYQKFRFLVSIMQLIEVVTFLFLVKKE